jgi:hypothetical protein
MKRIVTFKAGDQKNQQRFALLYGAILVGAQTQSRGTGIDVLRKEGRVLDALDSVSDQDDSPEARMLPTGERARKVRDGAELVLAQPEHELLKKRVEEGPWTPAVARNVVDCVDWFSAAAEQQE